MIDYDVTVTESLVQKVQGYILLLIMFTFCMITDRVGFHSVLLSLLIVY